MINLMGSLKKNTALITLMGHLFMMAAPAMAANNANTNALNFDSNKMPSKDMDCNNFCSAFTTKNSDGSFRSRGRGAGDEGGKGEVKGLDGTLKWGSEDDQWCANHGSVTDSSAGPGPKVKLTTSSTCNVPMTTADVSNGDTCKSVNEKLIRCKFKNTQAEQHCMAYQAAHDGEAFDWVMLGLNISATVTCTSACAAANNVAGLVASPALEMACGVAGMAVGTTEFISTVAQSNSTVASILKGTLSAAGATGGVVATSVSGTALKGQGLTDTAKTAEKVAACATAAVFAIQTGVRVASIAQMGGTQDAACKAIQTLASGATVASPNGNPDVTNRNYIPGNGTGGGGGGSGSGGSTGGNLTPTDIASNELTRMQGTNPSNLEESKATDAGLLTRSGLDKLVAPMAAQLDLDAFKRNLSGGAGPMLSSAMGGAGGGELAGNLAQLAQASQENAGLLGGTSGGSMYASGGGSGAGGSKGAASDNPFANLFGGGAKDSGARGPATEQFGKDRVSDIWHTGTTQNIFEIVSTKVSTVTSRVGVK